MILNKFLNESSFGLMGDHEPAECPLSESILITPDSMGVANAKAMDERERMKLDKAILYAESVIFVQQVKGADTSVLSENVVTDFFKKMYEMIKRAWARMVEWFKNLIKAIEISLRDVSKSLDGVQGKLNAKDMSDFKYYEHDWKEPNLHQTFADNTKDKIDTCKRSLNAILDNLNNPVKNDKNESYRKNAREREEQYKKEDFKHDERVAEVMGKSAGTEITLEEARDEIREAYGNDATAEEQTGLDMGHSKDMISFLQNFKKNKVLTEAQSSVDKHYKTVLDTVKNTESKITSSKNKVKNDAANKKNSDAMHDKQIALAKKILNEMASYITIYDTLMACCMDQEKAKFKEYKGIIISAVRYSPKKK